MAVAPDLGRADPPVSPAQVGATTVTFVALMSLDSTLARVLPAVAEALLAGGLPTLVFWLLRPRRSSNDCAR
jgi:hypothetical protein